MKKWLSEGLLAVLRGVGRRIGPLLLAAVIVLALELHLLDAELAQDLVSRLCAL